MGWSLKAFESWWGVVRGSVTLLLQSVFSRCPRRRAGAAAGGGCRGTRRERGALEGFGGGGWPKPTMCRGEQVGAWTREGGRGTRRERGALEGVGGHAELLEG